MNDGDLIRREDALLECCRGCRKDSAHGCTVPCPEYINISNLAAVDAVEVVRCKDCKFMNINEESCESCRDVDECCGVCMRSGGCARFGEYCSHGERRSE